MSEALAGDGERAGGLLHLVGLVLGRLGVLHLRYFQILADPVEVLLRLLELSDVPKHQSRKGSSQQVSDDLMMMTTRL